MSRFEYDPDWIPPPGATIDDLLSRKSSSDARSLILKHLGDNRIRMLLEGQHQIDATLASVLEHSVGLSASFWLERERLYRAALAQRQSEKQFLDELPLEEMKRRTLIKPLHSHAETVAEVVEFFGSCDPETFQAHVEQLPALIKQKASRTIVSRRGSLAVWVRAGEIEAGRVQCAEWDRDLLQDMLPEFRKLTRIEDPRKYLPELRNLCQRCGIAFVVVRAFSGCSARGVVKFISSKKAIRLNLSLGKPQRFTNR